MAGDYLKQEIIRTELQYSSLKKIYINLHLTVKSSSATIITMKFYSTKKNSPDVDFKTAIYQGIAPDGGLYNPRSIPQFTKKELDEIKTIHDAAYITLRKWIPKSDIPNHDLKLIVRNSFTFPIPIVTVGNFSILELFHGPTMAFKDIAGRVLARLFAYYLEKDKKTITVLVATSGDTGGAIAQAFSGVQNVTVVIIYPQGKVSELQEEQLTRTDKNVLSIAIEGDFDDCQEFIKRAFTDKDLQNLHLTSANSINIGRLLPQVIYYVWAYSLLKSKDIRFIIPSGNMGDATAALLALLMGIPIQSLIIATNENDMAVKYYNTGLIQRQKTVHTLSTAMDIGSPNNFERMLSMLDYNHEAFCKIISAVKVSDKDTVDTIKRIFSNEKYLMDFHTAVGYSAAEQVSATHSPSVVVSTAAPQKFAREIGSVTGISVDNTQILKKLRMKSKNVVYAGNNYAEIKKILLAKLS